MKVIISLIVISMALTSHAGILAGPTVNPANGHTYYLLTQNTWTNAEAEAVALGGHLATIRNAEEQQWIFATFGGHGGSLWIGLTDQEQEGTFKWVSGEPVDFTHWEETQPDNGTGGVEHYAHIWPPGSRSPGKWNDFLNADNVFGYPLYGVVEISSRVKTRGGTAQAQAFSGSPTDFTYERFASAAGLILQGESQLVENRLRLTPALGGRGGGAWRNTKQSVRNGFSTVFQFQITERGSSGADGMTFVIQNSVAPGLGYPGCNLGFGGLTNVFVIKFDNYHWQDHAPGRFDEVAVLTCSSPTTPLWDGAVNTIASVTNGVGFSDGQVHTAKIVYVPGNLQVYLDDLENPLMTVYVNIAKVVNLDNGHTWAGFTAATGADYQQHEILNWSFASNDTVSRPNLSSANQQSSEPSASKHPAVFHADVLPDPTQTTPLLRDRSCGYGLPAGIGPTHGIEASSDLAHWSPA
ncbi:MAG: hypothetical protein H7Y43_17050, partial [Akkermansiaceae bacterium]|nr:hypothetical protein [Verrucomicrobiales bacterium]